MSIRQNKLSYRYIWTAIDEKKKIIYFVRVSQKRKGLCPTAYQKASWFLKSFPEEFINLNFPDINAIYELHYDKQQKLL